MKATVKESHTFKPITVELVIESEVELAWLKAISDMSIASIVKECENNNNLLKNFEYKDIDAAQMKFYYLMDEL